MEISYRIAVVLVAVLAEIGFWDLQVVWGLGMLFFFLGWGGPGIGIQFDSGEGRRGGARGSEDRTVVTLCTMYNCDVEEGVLGRNPNESLILI